MLLLELLLALELLLIELELLLELEVLELELTLLLLEVLLLELEMELLEELEMLEVGALLPPPPPQAERPNNPVNISVRPVLLRIIMIPSFRQVELPKIQNGSGESYRLYNAAGHRRLPGLWVSNLSIGLSLMPAAAKLATIQPPPWRPTIHRCRALRLRPGS